MKQIIPDKITIGCFEYRVVETDDPIIINGNDCKGGIDYLQQTIKIKKSGISEQQKELTFWHEVVHGIFNYRTLDPEKNSEESITEELARGLYGIMKANGLLPGQKAGDA